MSYKERAIPWEGIFTFWGKARDETLEVSDHLASLQALEIFMNNKLWPSLCGELFGDTPLGIWAKQDGFIWGIARYFSLKHSDRIRQFLFPKQFWEEVINYQEPVVDWYSERGDPNRVRWINIVFRDSNKRQPFALRRVKYCSFANYRKFIDVPETIIFPVIEKSHDKEELVLNLRNDKLRLASKNKPFIDYLRRRFEEILESDLTQYEDWKLLQLFQFILLDEWQYLYFFPYQNPNLEEPSSGFILAWKNEMESILYEFYQTLSNFVFDKLFAFER